MAGKELTVYIFVDIFDALDAACSLDVEMTLVLTEQIRIIGHNPTAVNIIIELIIALDGSEFGSALWPLVLWIAISFYLCLLTIWKGKAFTTFAS